MSTGKVDATRKVTVSLGGSCRLRCTHCYITAPQFRFQKRRSVEEVIRFLKSCRNDFDAICISGDTDPLLDEEGFCRLLAECAHNFPEDHLMFTTRLVPNDVTMGVLERVGKKVVDSGRLFVPAVSFMTYSYPNTFENVRMVPPPSARIEFMQELAVMGFPILAAMRPTLPFELIPRAEVETLIDHLVGKAAAILGEIFIVDENNVLAERAGLQPFTGLATPLTFLAQPGLWRRVRFDAEIDFVRSSAHQRGVPFFLRSMSGIRYLEENANRRSAHHTHPPIMRRGCHDDQDP